MYPHVGFLPRLTRHFFILWRRHNAALWVQISLSRGLGDQLSEDGIVNTSYGSIQCQAEGSSNVQWFIRDIQHRNKGGCQMFAHTRFCVYDDQQMGGVASRGHGVVYTLSPVSRSKQ